MVITPPFVIETPFPVKTVQEPPVVGDTLEPCPWHIDTGLNVTIGNALTNTFEVVFEHPVTLSVYVKLTNPGLTPVTTPVDGTILADPEIGLEIHVPPEFGDKLIVPPTHTEVDAFTIGLGFTVRR